jgi:hypothetical protein
MFPSLLSSSFSSKGPDRLVSTVSLFDLTRLADQQLQDTALMGSVSISSAAQIARRPLYSQPSQVPPLNQWPSRQHSVVSLVNGYRDSLGTDHS